MVPAKYDHLSDELLDDNESSDSVRLLLKNINSLNGVAELNPLLEQSLSVIEKVMHVEASSLMLLDESGGELIISMPSGTVRRKNQGNHLAKGTGVRGWVLEHAEPYFTNAPSSDEHFAGDISDDITTENILCVPMVDSDGAVFGMLQAINRNDKQGFQDHDIPVFEALSNHVAMAIERTREFDQLQQQLDEKEVMLTEIHHRLKNNLFTITALIEMELTEVEDETALRVLKKTSARINAMTSVHDLLYGSGLGKTINMDRYLERITEKIAETLSHASQDVSISVEALDIQLDTERAMSCGLLLNEMIMNCYKHAFKKRSQDGQIKVELSDAEDGYIMLRVSDNGDGVGDDFTLGHSDTVGGWLIDVLVKRLDGTIDIDRRNGTSCVIYFKK